MVTKKYKDDELIEDEFALDFMQNASSDAAMNVLELVQIVNTFNNLRNPGEGIPQDVLNLAETAEAIKSDPNYGVLVPGTDSPPHSPDMITIGDLSQTKWKEKGLVPEMDLESIRDKTYIDPNYRPSYGVNKDEGLGLDEWIDKGGEWIDKGIDKSVEYIQSVKKGIDDKVADWMLEDEEYALFKGGDDLIEYNNQKARDIRTNSNTGEVISMLDADGKTATHKMAHVEIDGKEVVFPTIFPQEGGWLTFNVKNEDGSWNSQELKKAYDYAEKQEELFFFENFNDAQGFSEGNWKIEDNTGGIIPRGFEGDEIEESYEIQPENRFGP